MSLLKKLQEIIKSQTAPVQDKVEEEVVACTYKSPITDEDKTSEEIQEKPYTGVPAPAYLKEDPWFGSVPVYTEKQRDYMEMEFEMKQQEEEQRKEKTKEPDNIHEMMYNIATGNRNTTVQLDPPGGSENFHEGPGGWNSGTGQNQFR